MCSINFSHWEKIRKCVDILSKGLQKGQSQITNSTKPKLTQKAPPNLIGLKPITLKEMNIRRDHIYEGYVLKVLSTDYALAGAFPSIHFLIVDENYDVQRCFLYNLSNSFNDIQKQFGFGSSFSILNPYPENRYVSDSILPGIRIDDPRSGIHTTTFEKRCRFCYTGTFKLIEAKRSWLCAQCIVQKNARNRIGRFYSIRWFVP